MEYYRPILERRYERLANLRAQSGSLIQTELTVLGLLLVVLVVLPAGTGRVLGFWAAAIAGLLYAASILVQLRIHATRNVQDMPNEDDVYAVQLTSTPDQIRGAELEGIRARLDELRPRHKDHAERYRLGFALFQGGTLIIGLAALTWIATEVMT